MTDLFRAVRWRREGRRYTLWHIPVDVPADATGQTACGRRYPRRAAETGGMADGALCRNCMKAMQGSAPGGEA